LLRLDLAYSRPRITSVCAPGAIALVPNEVKIVNYSGCFRLQDVLTADQLFEIGLVQPAVPHSASASLSSAAFLAHQAQPATLVSEECTYRTKD
jgi:hypothetical protein